MVRKGPCPGREQPLYIALHWDQLLKLVECGGYRESQQVLGFIRSITVVGEAAEVVICHFVAALITFDKNKRERDTYLRFEVLDKESIVVVG